MSHRPDPLSDAGARAKVKKVNMSESASDLEALELYLDGELEHEARLSLEARLEREPQLSAMRIQLEQNRRLRRYAMDGPAFSLSAIDSLIASVRQAQLQESQQLQESSQLRSSGQTESTRVAQSDGVVGRIDGGRARQGNANRGSWAGVRVAAAAMFFGLIVGGLLGPNTFTTFGPAGGGASTAGFGVLGGGGASSFGAGAYTPVGMEFDQQVGDERNAVARHIVTVKDADGRILGQYGFNTLEDATRFADEVRRQSTRPTPDEPASQPQVDIACEPL